MSRSWRGAAARSRVSETSASLVTLLLAAAAWTLAWPEEAAGRILINEVLYDPAGEDAGAEFVELWNDGAAAATLEGFALESGDGARPGAWSVVFTGSSGDTVPARAPFLIAGSRLLAALQNGPDALRLLQAGVAVDLVGWGPLADPAMFEGAPAPDVDSGESLARRRDGADQDRNDVDWVAAESPTPGRPNRPARDVRLSLDRAPWPEVVWPGESARVEVTARNSGAEPLAAGAWKLDVRLRDRSAAGGAAWSDVGSVVGSALEAGESATLEVSARPASAGPYDVGVVSIVGFDGAGSGSACDSAEISGRVGAGPVVIQEIAFHDAGAGEWVELLATEGLASWEGFSLGDASGALHPLRATAGSAVGRAGTIRIAASDPARLLARFALPESLILTTAGGWPSLNDAEAVSGFPPAPYADVVRVVASDGTPSDAAPYCAEWSARGESLERLSPRLPSAASASWTESVAPSGGTPGAANSVSADGLDREGALPLLASTARVLRRDGPSGSGALVLELGTGVVGRAVRLRILDLRGRVLRVLADGSRFGAAGAVVWDGRDDSGREVSPGIYIARLEAGSSGSPPRRASLAVAVAPPGGAR